MALINFQKQFASAVKNGEKTQTIRTPRKHLILEGDTLYLYTGLRTKYTEKLKEAVCTGVTSVVIEKLSYSTPKGTWSGYLDLDAFAKRDGFSDWSEMISWFDDTHGLPFNGWLIKWEG